MSHAKCVGDLCTILCSRLSVGVPALVQGDFVKHKSKSQVQNSIPLVHDSLVFLKGGEYLRLDRVESNRVLVFVFLLWLNHLPISWLL